jgi:transcription factor E
MLEKFLKEYVSIVAGSGTDKIVDVLFKKKNVNEFLIAKKLNMTINQTRNILYKLADSGLVHFMRKKDLKSGGWYTYFWTLDDHKCLVNYKASITNEITNQQNVLALRKTKQFYICKNCNIEVSDEQALLNEFTCTECGEVYSLKDSVEGIKEIEKIIQKMTEKADLIQVEIDKLVASKPKEKEKKKGKKVTKSKPKKEKKASKKVASKKGKKK